jgi:hypothetical protein
LTVADSLTIQRFPRGLLGLLGTQAGGDTPQQLSPIAGGVVDLLPFYTADLRRTAQANVGNVGAAGTLFVGSSVVACPVGEMWLVHEAGAQCTAAAPAATTARIALALERLQGTTVVYAFDERAVATGEIVNVSLHFEVPLVMLPGDVWGIFCAAMAGGPIGPFFMNVTYTRIQI